MTREEAISRINNDLECHKKELSAPYKTALKMAIEALQEQRIGYWMDKKVFTLDDVGPIEEWQSCCCSECGRYDTSPYSYYFREPNYCSWCGSKMGKRKPEECK